MLRETSTGDGAVVRRRGRRRALPQPHRRQDPARRDAATPRAHDGAGPAGRGRRAPAPSVIDNVKLIRDLDLAQTLDDRALRARARASARRGSPKLTRDKRFARARAGRWCSRAPTPPARAARSGASPARSTRGSTLIVPDRARRPTRSGRTPTCGGSGATSRRGRHHDLRPHLVRPRAGRARRGLLLGRRLDARLRRDQPASRSSSSDAGVIVVQVLAADQQGRAAARASRRASRRRSSASRSRRRTGATARSGPTTSARSRDMVDRTQHRARAVDAGRGRRQALRAHQGAAHASSSALERGARAT